VQLLNAFFDGRSGNEAWKSGWADLNRGRFFSWHLVRLGMGVKGRREQKPDGEVCKHSRRVLVFLGLLQDFIVNRFTQNRPAIKRGFSISFACEGNQ
jgi:hypothetical protein